MVGDFVSPDYGWLKGKDGSRARVLFRCGKKRDGYQTTDNIIAQATKAMDILEKDFPDEVHVLAYDNATIHTARAPTALTTKGMTLNPKKDFVFEVKQSNGLVIKEQMRDGEFPDGSPQSFYYPDDYHDAELAGCFKGMRTIIKERFDHGANVPDPIAMKLKADCAKPKKKEKGKGKRKEKEDEATEKGGCKEGARDCCCRRVLYYQPDFVKPKSRLEEHCEARGFEVIFFPKYHPELNCIEQCWGFAKRIYRMFPLSSKDEDLESNLLSSLAQVPLTSIRRFATRSSRFTDSYYNGLSGAEAAWACKKYRGHRMLPSSFEEDLEVALKANPIRLGAARM
jgi:hypothetical protein